MNIQETAFEELAKISRLENMIRYKIKEERVAFLYNCFNFPDKKDNENFHTIIKNQFKKFINIVTQALIICKEYTVAEGIVYVYTCYSDYGSKLFTVTVKKYNDRVDVFIYLHTTYKFYKVITKLDYHIWNMVGYKHTKYGIKPNSFDTSNNSSKPISKKVMQVSIAHDYILRCLTKILTVLAYILYDYDSHTDIF